MNWKLVFNLIYMIPCLVIAFITWYITFKNVGVANITFWLMMLIGHIFMYFETWLTYVVVVMLAFSTVTYIVLSLNGRSVSNHE